MKIIFNVFGKPSSIEVTGQELEYILLTSPLSNIFLGWFIKVFDGKKYGQK